MCITSIRIGVWDKFFEKYLDSPPLFKQIIKLSNTVTQDQVHLSIVLQLAVAWCLLLTLISVKDQLL